MLMHTHTHTHTSNHHNNIDESSQTEIATLRTTIKHLEETITMKNTILAQTVDNITKDNSALRQRGIMLQRQFETTLDSLRHDNHIADTLATQLQHQVDVLNKHIVQNEIDREEIASGSNPALSNDFAALTAELVAATSTIESLTSTQLSLESDVSRVTSELNHSEGLVVELQRNLAQVTAKAADNKPLSPAPSPSPRPSPLPPPQAVPPTSSSPTPSSLSGPPPAVQPPSSSPTLPIPSSTVPPPSPPSSLPHLSVAQLQPGSAGADTVSVHSPSIMKAVQTELGGEIVRLSTYADELEETVSTLRSECASLRSTLAEQHHLTQQLTAQNRQLTADNMTLQSNVDQHHAVPVQQQKHLQQQHQQQLQQQQLQQQQLQAKVSNLERAIDSLTVENHRLETEAANAIVGTGSRSSKPQIVAHVKNLLGKLASSEADISRQRIELSRLEQETSFKQTKCVDYLNDVKRLKLLILKQNASFANMNLAQETLRLENQQLQRQLSSVLADQRSMSPARRAVLRKFEASTPTRHPLQQHHHQYEHQQHQQRQQQQLQPSQSTSNVGAFKV
eukprot:m.224713 g.224713  ORF g.224713 m.224713 type:complete len:564 (-) comp33440_c0_seq1:88-1779(-)